MLLSDIFSIDIIYDHVCCIGNIKFACINRQLIKEVDEKRASFHKFCTGKEWEYASQYQLSIDTGSLYLREEKQ